MKYELINKFGLKIQPYSEGLEYIEWDELKDKLKELKITGKFNNYFGCQTCTIFGPYPWDVEAVLQRIFNDKLVGTQLFPD